MPPPSTPLHALLLQDSFLARATGVRREELSLLWRSFVVASVNSSTVLAIPILTAVATFAAYSLFTGLPLTAAQGAGAAVVLLLLLLIQ